MTVVATKQQQAANIHNVSSEQMQAFVTQVDIIVVVRGNVIYIFVSTSSHQRADLLHISRSRCKNQSKSNVFSI